MRSVIAVTILLASTNWSLACTAGGIPCDEAFRRSLENIDTHRKENMERGELIEQRQHALELERMKREHARELERIKLQKEIDAARRK